ncbi:MAG: aldose epimerase family protein [candidate division FCPU426 bacterium]
MKKISLLIALAAVLGLSACKGAKPDARARGVVKAEFGKLADGRSVELYTLTNAKGMRLKISNYGGTVVAIEAADRKGAVADVVLGFDDLDSYVKSSPYFGALIGRTGNRIAGGKFKLDGKTFTLAKNDGSGPNNLHGGVKGFDKVLWEAQVVDNPGGPALLLKYLSKDGEEGFPGNLSVEALHVWTDDNTLKIEFKATTDKPTVVNLTHHSYFNLAGAGQGDILGHELMIPADRYNPVDKNLIPTGELRPVKGGPFDFSTGTMIGSRIQDKDPQLHLAKGGYDHNWILTKKAGDTTLVARVKEPVSGRVLEVMSSEPGVQFYSGNFLDGTLKGKAGAVYGLRTGFCLEPQHFPDSPNHPKFPSIVLRPGQSYRHTLSYHFFAE